MGFNPFRRDRRSQGRQRRDRRRGLTPPKFFPLLILTPFLANPAHARVVAESQDLNGWLALGAIAGVLALGLLLQSTRRLR